MNFFILTFLAGNLFLQTFAELPSIFISLMMILTALIFWRSLKKKSKLAILPLAFAIGFAYAHWHAHSTLAWTLKKDWEIKPLIATGTIVSLPRKGKFGTQFEFHLEKLSNQQLTEYPYTKIKLITKDNKIYPGDKWQFLVKLKRIHGLQSIGAYDYEAWSFEHGIRASGTVKDSHENKLIAHQQWKYPLQTLRQYLQNKINEYSPHTQTSPWLSALIIGERNGISQENWQVLRNTGTNHLMAIGGLHIGIMAGIFSMLVSFLWKRHSRLPLIFPAQHAALISALIIAFIYASLSGFSLPSQRAIIMLTVFILISLTHKRINPFNAWSLALLIVIILNPATVLSESFWLSFGTIALIIYGMSNRLSPSGFWWKHGRVQWVIGVGLIPLSLTLFQECSLVSFIANTIAIPLFAMIILPLCFVSTVFLIIQPTIGSLLLLLADKSLAGLWMILTWLSHLKWASFHIAMPNFYILFFTSIGFLILLLPSGTPLRLLGIIWILPLFLYQQQRPREGEYYMNLLDVGQGLSVVIQTATHTLLYDAGPKLEASSDMGERIVLPFLRSAGIKKIDLMVISHADNDHIGGANAILNAYRHTPIKTSAPEKFSSSHVEFCNAGDAWKWDGVNFTFLYPMNYDNNSRNDNSCVLMIDNGKYKILLTGDIEKYAEQELLHNMPEKLAANIIVAPHHGSKTSGIPKFISAVHPEIVLYATGYRNRYHFPHPSVIKEYEKINALAFNTSESGSIQFIVGKNGLETKPQEYRKMNKKYWNE